MPLKSWNVYDNIKFYNDFKNASGATTYWAVHFIMQMMYVSLSETQQRPAPGVVLVCVLVSVCDCVLVSCMCDCVCVWFCACVCVLSVCLYLVCVILSVWLCAFVLVCALVCILCLCVSVCLLYVCVLSNTPPQGPCLCLVWPQLIKTSSLLISPLTWLANPYVTLQAFHVRLDIAFE